ncbi:YihY family inner membrane protein [Legionella londiniensis]|uniref:UPF0761 membrane protein Llon_0128 n=1 Tax=Legionella londiniensis TaxID=45068 RepID=A0A0W0VSX3_9GAMM|nr:YihY family inner membrane protein [Legionella londiniensis]KTD23243.1 ribonuclease BN [Legionella londiniensis]STX93746.1 ribonuclease BN [Legionella londiniensis]
MDLFRLKKWLSNRINEGKRFTRFVIKHFIEDDCTYRASALAFATLLAIVPLMSVGFSILSSFPVFQKLAQPLQDFIFENFVPATGKIIQNYLQLFARQVTKLSVIGVIFLFVTALLVMYTIERSMNKIWRVSTSRHGVTAFLLYWAILSLAPFLLGLSLAASSYFVSLPLIRGYYAPSLVFNSIPFFLSLIGFTFLYVVVPNCPVRITHGIIGAAVAALLFETAKHAFAFYLSQIDTYELLYGAFATIPIFLIWIYWVWLITLLGAEISYALSVHHKRRKGAPLDGFSHALLWLQCLWKAQQHGHSVSLETLTEVSEQPFEIDVDKMLAKFLELKLITATIEGDYILSRDLTRLSLYEFLKLLPYRLPTGSELKTIDSPDAKRWIAEIKKVNQELKESLGMTLDQLFRHG